MFTDPTRLISHEGDPDAGIYPYEFRQHRCCACGWTIPIAMYTPVGHCRCGAREWTPQYAGAHGQGG